MTHDEIQKLRIGDCIIRNNGAYSIITGWKAKGIKKAFVACQRGASACEFIAIAPQKKIIPISEIVGKFEPRSLALAFCIKETYFHERPV